MTDGSLIYDEHSNESKVFNVKDGLGISTWLKIGGEVAIITGRESKIVQRRARELGIIHIYQGVKNKKEVLENMLNVLGITTDEVAVIGDDLNDLGMIKLVNRSFTPADGMDVVKKEVDTILSKKGGQGAIREMIDIIVKENSMEEEFLNIWL
jgi:3-deoxy-D-manno-octulosonate 8-phosphate phosphatase (KDO 8-P phosphatase)